MYEFQYDNSKTESSRSCQKFIFVMNKTNGTCSWSNNMFLVAIIIDQLSLKSAYVVVSVFD